MDEEKLQEAAPKPEETIKEVRDSSGPGKEMCICGHRASRHTANRYACQAPGDRKGFCACMRFIARNSPIGKRMRTTRQVDPSTEPKPE